MTINRQTILAENKKILSLTPQVAVALKKYFEYFAHDLEDDDAARRLGDFIDTALNAMVAVANDDMQYVSETMGHLPENMRKDLLELLRIANESFQDTTQLRKLFTAIKTAPNKEIQIKFFLKNLEILRKHIQDETTVIEQHPEFDPAYEKAA